MPEVPRYLPDQPWPCYAYVPGRQPHPVSNPQGHSYGAATASVEPPDPNAPTSSLPFLRGLDLFNHGYYWEAHELWEALWKACGRSGPTAAFLKGLIKLAAAGVKAREGNADGVRRHARRAAELFGDVRKTRSGDETHYFGLPLDQLTIWSIELAADPPLDDDPRVEGQRVFPFVLKLE